MGPSLRIVGFPINKPWDGMSETTPAVTRFEPKTLEADLSVPASRKERTGFVEGLNAWLEEIRKEGSRSER